MVNGDQMSEIIVSTSDGLFIAANGKWSKVQSASIQDMADVPAYTLAQDALTVWMERQGPKPLPSRRKKRRG
jgi:hypothetical protein